MKKLYFYFSIMISTSSLAQTSVYHPFPDSNAVWNVEIVSQCSTSTVTREWYSYVMNGDTNIGGSLYHKIYIPMFIDSSQCFGNSTLGGYYFGCIRQDTTLKRVYFIESSSTIEKLLYDFNIQVGDTLHGNLTNYGDCADDSVITEMDSIFINGNFRKRWKVPTMLMPQYIIEGIGYIGGPFTPICSWEGSSYLSCFTQDNIVLYMDTSNVIHPGLCGIINSASSTKKINSPFLYPNPFHDYVILESPMFPATIEIYNLLGIKVFEQKIVSNQTIIQTNHLENGLYFYLLKNNSSETSSGKFVKE